jgi:hypothetical protein
MKLPIRGGPFDGGEMDPADAPGPRRLGRYALPGGNFAIYWRGVEADGVDRLVFVREVTPAEGEAIRRGLRLRISREGSE